uniref:Dynein heavy chain 3, axonemal n=1 Tax=Poecilia reticulata TaxID=8081 RepID=A0A3P9MWQ3_POERE
ALRLNHTQCSPRDSRYHPFPPPLPEKCAADPSDIYQVVQRHSNYPPIIQTNTFRVSVPFKEQRHHRAPSESIGNNYSPKAQDLKIDKLTRQRPSRKSSATATGPKRTSRDHLFDLNSLAILTFLTQRYTYYVKRGIPFYMLAPYPKQSMVNIKNMLPPEPEEGVKKPIRTLRNNLTEEVEDGYYFNLRKSIVDYILMDPSEGLRLTINNIPKPFPRRVIRPPVPWAVSYREAKLWQMQHLFNVCPFMGLLQQIWIERYSSLRFVKTTDLISTTFPLSPSEFVAFIQEQCERRLLSLRWLPYCVSLFVVHEHMWVNLLPENEPILVAEFFHCVAALMSLQLRSLVIDSLQDLLQFFLRHKEGNDFSGDFDVLIFVHSQILLVKLQVKNSEIEFSPSFQECWEVIREAFMQIIRSAEDLLTYLSTVRPDESLVTDILAQVEEAFQKNTVGPIRYLDLYEKYRNLLDNKSDEEISEFISSTHSLQDSAKKIDSIMRMWMKIASLRIAVPLSMFCLNARDLNDYLCDCANKLIARIVTFEMDENRRLNIDLSKWTAKIKNVIFEDLYFGYYFCSCAMLKICIISVWMSQGV